MITGRGPRPGDIIEVEIDRLTPKGLGEASVEILIGPQEEPRIYAVFVRKAIPGDLVKMRVEKTRRKRITGGIVEIIKPSMIRIEPRCPHFGQREIPGKGCGGCTLQTLSYRHQLAVKERGIKELMQEAGVDPGLVAPVLGMDDPWYYRNKMEFSFGDYDEREFALGLHPTGFQYDVLNIRECYLESEFVSRLLPVLRDWCAERGLVPFIKGEGFVKNLIIREGKRTGDRLVELVTGHGEESLIDGEVRPARAIAEAAGPRDLVIVLISGGGSSLWTVPRQGITLGDVQEVTHFLLRSGATIDELNTVRKHLCCVVGGQLAKSIYPARSLTLILSDVLNSPLDVIASGPTVADSTSFADAWRVLEKYQLQDRVPASTITLLKDGMAGAGRENPGPDDPAFEHTQTIIIGDNIAAAQAACEAAQRDGFESRILTTALDGEAREVGLFVAGLGLELVSEQGPDPQRVCLILAGETTVTLQGHGKGGRNQELAVSAASILKGKSAITIASLATDGTDGPTDAAGAIVDGNTVTLGEELGLSVHRALAENDSYPYLEATGDLLLTGPTDTNVNDVIFVVVEA
ncbi:MAG: DUF4147 domain-containing protein [Bradymonadaceae bacterium]